MLRCEFFDLTLIKKLPPGGLTDRPGRLADRPAGRWGLIDLAKTEKLRTGELTPTLPTEQVAGRPAGAASSSI